ncbi:MAG: glutathione S-transferase family protein [Hyphomicrobium sp.]
MLKLYKAGNSICTQKVLITLAEKGLAPDTQDIDLFNNEQFKPEYLKINPKGVVPALAHDDHIVTESTLICEYLDDTFPEPRLIPADAYARTRMRKWSKAVDEGLFEATRELSFSAMFRERMRTMTEEQRQGRFRNVGDPNKRARFMSSYELGVESPYVLLAIANYETAFKDMEAALAGNPAGWLVGPSMTLADINMMPFVARLAYLKLLDVWVGDRPHTRAWWERVQKLPSFRTAISDPLTPREFDVMATSGGKIAHRAGELRQQYLAEVKAAPKPAA